MPSSQSAFLVWLRHFVKHFEGEGLASVLFLCHEELSEPTGFHYLFQAFHHKKKNLVEGKKNYRPESLN